MYLLRIIKHRLLTVRHYIILLLRLVAVRLVVVYRRIVAAGYLYRNSTGDTKWRKTLPEKEDSMTRIVSLSDTHGHHRHLEVPDCDILIHSGDSFMGKDPTGGWDLLKQLKHFLKIGKVKKYIIMVGGNHDFLFSKNANMSEECSPIIWLNQSEITLDGLKWYGVPNTIQKRSNNTAWQLKRQPLQAVWRDIPSNTDILISHQAPKSSTCLQGCNMLSRRVLDVNPRIHFHGHLHDSYGVSYMESIISVNAASCRGHLHHPLYAPIVIDVPLQKWAREKAETQQI